MLKWLGIRKVSGGADTLAAPATSPTVSQPDENLRLSVTRISSRPSNLRFVHPLNLANYNLVLPLRGV
jgi:hypothetical protein